MGRNAAITVAMAGGLVWSVALLWSAARFVEIPVFTLMPTIMTAFLTPGLVMAAMIGWIARRRFGDDKIIGAQSPSGNAGIDRRILSTATEQLVLALCIWPGAAVILGGAGPGVIVMLGLGLALALIVFWIGCRISVPLRVFGLVASFCPTVLVALWAMLSLSGLFPGR
ncbi:MAPEG family protein [Roseovarius sp. TE539]|uniref:MAPEG family protein n=1 Tax=Roseovarius sp. TE539 TaxID=2249812 RepID=UPI000E042B9F|nr:MAPEG family protein [Roseovarius sp. TE539]RBI77144.1 MAPEG family protein [Roseovarius sp. TE539]